MSNVYCNDLLMWSTRGVVSVPLSKSLIWGSGKKAICGCCLLALIHGHARNPTSFVLVMKKLFDALDVNVQRKQRRQRRSDSITV